MSKLHGGIGREREREGGRGRERERSFVCWFPSQMAVTFTAAADQSQESRAALESPMWVAGAQAAGHHLLLFSVHSRTAGWEV